MTEQELKNFNEEKARQEVSIIRNSLPKFMVPGFNTVISSNKDYEYLYVFIHTYADFLKDSIEKGIEPITPADAFSHFKERMDKEKASFDNYCEENNVEAEPEEVVVADDEMDIPVQDEVADESEEVTEDDTTDVLDSDIDGELESLDDEANPSDEPVDII